MSRREKDHPTGKLPADEKRVSDDSRRARFAAEIARSEFGRFYWNDRQAGEMKRAMQPRRRPPEKRG